MRGGGDRRRGLRLVRPVRLLVRHRAEAPDQHRRVHLAAGDHRVEDPRVRVEVVHHRGQVDRVARGCRTRSEVADLRLEPVGQLRDAEPVGRQDAGRDHRDAAAVGQDRDPPAARPARHQQALRRLHQLLRRRHQQRAGIAQRGLDDTPARHQRAGVRLRGAGGRLPGRRQHDHRLARTPGRGDRAQEPAAVAEVLAVDADRAHALVAGQVRDEIAGRQVGLVPDRDEVRQPERHLDAVRHELDAEPARLRHDRERPRRLALVEPGRVERFVPAPHAHAVRPEQHGAGLPDARRHALLQRTPLRPGLREADRDPDERAHAASQAVIDHLLEGPRRHHQHGAVDGLRQLAQRRHRGVPLHLGRARVHEVHPAPAGAAQHAARDPEAPLRGVVGRPDDRDRARCEQRLQLPLRHVI